MPRWTLGVAFALGLLPGLLLYWRARPIIPAVIPTPVSVPAPITIVPQPEPEPAKSEDPQAKTPRRGGTAVFDAAELGRMLAERSHQLEVAKVNQADLTRQLRELEAKLDTLSQEETRRKNVETELREMLTGAQKETDSVRNTLQAHDATLRETEAANLLLKKQVGEANQKAGRRKQASTELDEIGRRRESYLTTIIGRYREATDLFRAMSLRLDNPRDAGSPLNNDLSRIQQAIQLADEDLRQLRMLNAQAARLQKDLN